MPEQAAHVRKGKEALTKAKEAESKVGPPLLKPNAKKIKSNRPMTVEERLGKKIPMGKYNTPMDVKEAFDRGNISEADAQLILKQKFGME